MPSSRWVHPHLDAADRRQGRCSETGLHYYFETRQKLFEQIAAYVGDRMLGPVEDAIEGLDVPAEIAGFDRLWREPAAEPELHGVYLGLIAESASDPPVAARRHDRSGRSLPGADPSLIAQVRAQGWTLKLPEETIVAATIASVQGLALQYLERARVRL